jgi:hypothetical protein
MTFDIPNKDGLWMFTSPSTWQTWVKPTQYNNFIIYLCGAGGSGASGNTNTSALNNRGGGGGGAGGQLAIINAPSFLLPETLYFNIGRGIQNSAGGASYLCHYPNTNLANIIMQCAGGSAGSAGGFGLAGAAGAGVFTAIPQTIFSISSTTSSAGTRGGLGGTGDNFSITTSCIYGGTGGGSINTAGTTFSGGNILASNIHPQLDGGLAPAGVGKSGYFIKKPFTSLGGTGGGANASATGGNGGIGSWGSGGGGGGASRSGTSIGGRGGDGFAIIIGY